jgi:hypothetical protein
VNPLAHPPQVTHDRIAVDHAQQCRELQPGLRLAPDRAGREALELGTDLQQQPQAAIFPARLVEERLDRLLVVVLGQRSDRPKGVDSARDVRDPLQHGQHPCRERPGGRVAATGVPCHARPGSFGPTRRIRRPELLSGSAEACADLLDGVLNGHLAGMVLDSVSNALVHRAECPVAVVRPAST